MKHTIKVYNSLERKSGQDDDDEAADGSIFVAGMSATIYLAIIIFVFYMIRYFCLPTKHISYIWFLIVSNIYMIVNAIRVPHLLKKGTSSPPPLSQ